MKKRIFLMSIMLFFLSSNSCAVLPGRPIYTQSPIQATGDDIGVTPMIKPTQEPGRECIVPFESFAYTAGYTKSVVEDPPGFPWKHEIDLPAQYFPSIDGMISRVYDGFEEIWLKALKYDDNGSVIENKFLIFKPRTREWKSVPGRIGNSHLDIDQLFVLKDGSIWGKTVWDSYSKPIPPEKAPVLTKYNEYDQRFEFASGALKIPPRQGSSYEEKIYVIPDGQNSFWIYVNKDGLYRYDINTETTLKIADFPELLIMQIALSKDGKIYLENYSDMIYSKEKFFQISKGMLWEFDTTTSILRELSLPEESWPIFNGMMVDSAGNLWLGAIGYRGADGVWNRMIPKPSNFEEHAGDIAYAPPRLMMESSNGYLWYSKDADIIQVNGTAWYDPQTGTGCLFTNLTGAIVEGSDRRIWMAADQALYTLEDFR